MQDDELKHTLNNLQVPPPSEEARTAALFLAKQAFEAEQQKKAKRRQGSFPKERPIHATTVVLEQIFGSFSMKKAYAYAGTLAAVSVIAITALNYQAIVGDIVPPPEKEIEIKIQSGAPGVDMTAPGMQGVHQETTGPTVATVVPAPPPAAPTGAASKALMALPLPPPPSPVATQEMAAQRGVYAGKSLADSVGVSHYIAPYPYQPPIYTGQDQFDAHKSNAVKSVKDEPVSTFSIDVDTASYSFVRRMINQGQLPPKDAVRVEEMINYFAYDYAVPENKSEPFKPTVAVYPTPWNANTKLMHIGIKGYDIAKAEKPRTNLVFLIDVSGSMNQPDKLPLVKQSLHMLVDQMDENDTIGIVTYAGYAGTALEPTNGSDKKRIHSVIDMLGAGGSTAGAAGIEQAYKLAAAYYNKNGVNRVILATDGDFNVGISNQEQLKKFIEEKRNSGVFLSILGFGQGNYNDALMQTLAQNGNGNAAYIDNANEARKVLVQEAGSTLFTIAKDVKIQVEFNPALVSEYRLIGYESRLLKREDFNNDKIDAGEVGAGHAVTAIYEITPADGKSQRMDDLRYGKQPEEKKPEIIANFNGEYAFLKIRYKLPKESESKLITAPISTVQEKPLAQQSDDIRFAGAVAAFGQILKGGEHVTGYSYDEIITLADGARGRDAFGYRSEFVNLVRAMKSLRVGQPVLMPQPAPGLLYPMPEHCPPGEVC
jgi:Ca-activated chloride channel family protein